MSALALYTVALLAVPPAPAWTEPEATAKPDGDATRVGAGLAVVVPTFGASAKGPDHSMQSTETNAPAPASGSWALAQSSPTIATRTPDGSFEAVGDDVLAEQRGGFSINGLDVTLGAQIETFLDGQLSLVTTVNWTDTSAVTSQTVSGLLTPASAAELQAGLLNTGHISMNVGDASVFLGNGGRTAVVHSVDQGIQNVLINTASDTSIKTQVTATIDLGGYAAFRSNLQLGTLAASLGQAIGAATTGAAMN